MTNLGKKEQMKRLRKRGERSSRLAEYVLILVLIAVVSIGVIGFVGVKTANTFNSVRSSLSDSTVSPSQNPIGPTIQTKIYGSGSSAEPTTVISNLNGNSDGLWYYQLVSGNSAAFKAYPAAPGQDVEMNCGMGCLWNRAGSITDAVFPSVYPFSPSYSGTATLTAQAVLVLYGDSTVKGNTFSFSCTGPFTHTGDGIHFNFNCYPVS